MNMNRRPDFFITLILFRSKRFNGILQGFFCYLQRPLHMLHVKTALAVRLRIILHLLFYTVDHIEQFLRIVQPIPLLSCQVPGMYEADARPRFHKPAHSTQRKALFWSRRRSSSTVALS